MPKVNIIVSIIVLLIIVIVAISVAAVLIPQAGIAGDSLNASNRCASEGCFFNATTDLCQDASASPTACPVGTTVPLSGLFSSNGVVFVIIMASILLIILFVAFGPLAKKR